VPRLAAFLAGVPDGTRAAFEFRNESWFDEETYEALRAGRAVLCAADTDDSGEAGPPLVPTADWGYLRLRRSEYTDADLGAWLARVRAQPWREAFVFFKHEDEGKGPACTGLPRRPGLKDPAVRRALAAVRRVVAGPRRTAVQHSGPGGSMSRHPSSAALSLCLALLVGGGVAPGRAHADSSTTTQRSVTKLAEGVYVIRHEDAPDTFPQGNTTVVIGDQRPSWWSMPAICPRRRARTSPRSGSGRTSRSVTS
jgi:hypothetical protein